MLTGSSQITEESRKYVTKTIVGSALVTVVTVPVLDFRCQCLQQQENQHWHWPGTSRELVTWLRHLNKGFFAIFTTLNLHGKSQRSKPSLFYFGK